MLEGIGAWNASAAASWNRLRTKLSRLTDIEYFRAVEVQDRGALHLHVIVWSADPLDVHEVQRLALEAGFGCVLDVQPLDAARHARYVSKYVTKATDDRDSVPWRRIVQVLDEETGELVEFVNPDPSYRAWSSSRRWGLTVRMVRAVHLAAVARSQVTRPADAGSTHTQVPATLAPAADGPEPAD